MDYDLSKQVLAQVEHSELAMPYGGMPDFHVTSKYEETYEDCEDVYDEDPYNDYARETLVDKAPEKNKFEHERSRTSQQVAAGGRLNMQYYGNRSGSDDPQHPEMFLGDTSRDPRGINVDPDMKQLRAQEQARMRFVRLDPDACEQTTGGGRSETQLMRDRQTAFKLSKGRMLLEGRQIDGRRNGKYGTYKNNSNIRKQVVSKSYGDMLPDRTTTFQRKANVICDSVIKDSQLWRDETTDSDFAVANYGQVRKRRTTTKHDPMANANSTDTKFQENGSNKQFKTCAILMSNVIKCKKQMVELVKTSDADYSTSASHSNTKSAPFFKDITHVIRAMKHDSDFKNSDQTTVGKTKSQTRDTSSINIVQNHLAPAHYYMCAEVMYKSVKPGSNAKDRKKIVGDALVVDGAHNTQSKGAKMRMLTGSKLSTDHDADRTESTRTVNYKQAALQMSNRMKVTSGEEYAKESDNSQTRKSQNQDMEAPTSVNQTFMGEFFDNHKQDRHIGVMGDKYTTRHIDRDTKMEYLGE
jgi:hypothetical protein